MRSSGIDGNRLYFTNKVDFINNNPHIKSQSQRYKNLCFHNNEINRNNLIYRSQSQRNMILNNENNKIKKYPNSPNLSVNFAYNWNNNNENEYFNTYIDKNKSMTDYWKLRYDKNKENERFYLIQKQNLAEVKNLIDQTVKLYNKARKNLYEDYIKNEEKKNKLKLEYQKKRDKEYINQEMMNKEIDLFDKKRQENEFRNLYLSNRKIEEEKEHGIIESQNHLMKKQKEWEMQNCEHMNKVENIYQKKHNLAINEYLDILKKDIKRSQKLNLIKDNFDHQNKIKNEKRELYLINFKKKKKDIEKNNRQKFEKRQKHISKFYEEQKELKYNLIKSQQKERNEKVEKNIFLKQLNDEMQKERRDRLLEQFEINEEKVERRKNIKEKMNEDLKFNNYMKRDKISSNYIEEKNILTYKNMLKLNNMKNKDKDIQEKIKRRQLSAKLKMERDNILKVKKQQMINHVNKILDERKEHNIEDIYKRIFTDEEMKILREEDNN